MDFIGNPLNGVLGYLEYWDGGSWVADIKKLKSLGRSEGERTINFIDTWKKELKMF